MTVFLARRILTERTAERDLLEAITEILAGAEKAATDAADQLGVALDTGPALDRVRAGVTDSIASLIRTDAAVLRSVAAQVVQGILPDEMMAVALATSVARAETLANTALAAVQRSVALDAAEAIGVRTAVYQGPLGGDPKTRPYCAALADLLVDLDRLASTPNGQRLPPLIYCGGYNCRHSLIPIDAETAAEMGVRVATDADYEKAIEGGRR